MHLCIEANNHEVREHLQASNLSQISPDPPFYQRLHLQTDLGCFHCQTELDKESETRKDLSLCRSGLPQSHFVQNKKRYQSLSLRCHQTQQSDFHGQNFHIVLETDRSSHTEVSCHWHYTRFHQHQQFSVSCFLLEKKYRTGKYKLLLCSTMVHCPEQCQL